MAKDWHTKKGRVCRTIGLAKEEGLANNTRTKACFDMALYVEFNKQEKEAILARA